MTVPILINQSAGNRMTCLQVSILNGSIAPGTPQALYSMPTGSALQVGYYIAHVPVTLSLVTGYGYLSSGSASGTIAYQLQTVAMSSPSSGVGGLASGAFANVSGATTGSITPTTTGGAMTPWINNATGVTSYNAGQIFQIVAVATTATVTNFCGSATLRVITQV